MSKWCLNQLQDFLTQNIGKQSNVFGAVGFISRLGKIRVCNGFL